MGGGHIKPPLIITKVKGLRMDTSLYIDVFKAFSASNETSKKLRNMKSISVLGLWIRAELTRIRIRKKTGLIDAYNIK